MNFDFPPLVCSKKCFWEHEIEIIERVLFGDQTVSATNEAAS